VFGFTHLAAAAVVERLAALALDEADLMIDGHYVTFPLSSLKKR
jgi:hypothetical protein